MQLGLPEKKNFLTTQMSPILENTPVPVTRWLFKSRENKRFFKIQKTKTVGILNFDKNFSRRFRYLLWHFFAAKTINQLIVIFILKVYRSNE